MDITDRKILEQQIIENNENLEKKVLQRTIELREKESSYKKLSEELSMIIDSLPGLVFYKDVKNNFIRVNKYIADAYKTTKENLEGKNLFDLHTKEVAQHYWDDDLEVIKSRKSKFNIEEEWDTESGKNWVLTSKIPHFNENNEVDGIIGVSIDITERKKLENINNDNIEKLRYLNDELIKSNKELDDFAYIASHDLREPLRGINNYSIFLLEDYSETLDEKGKEMLNSISNLSKRLEKFIDSLLYFSRLGRTEPKIEPVSIYEIIEENLELLDFNIKEKPTKIVNLSKDLIVNCDKGKTIEIYMNLISNALKYNDKVERHIEIGHLTNEKNELILYVRDNGIGIEGKYFDGIFKIFKRLHSRERYGGGVGAGLTITKKCIEMQGGNIWIESKLGVGTTFYFTLQNKKNGGVRNGK